MNIAVQRLGAVSAISSKAALPGSFYYRPSPA